VRSTASREETAEVSGPWSRKNTQYGRAAVGAAVGAALDTDLALAPALDAALDGPPRSTAPSVRTARIRLTVATPTRPDLDCRWALVTMGLCLSRKNTVRG